MIVAGQLVWCPFSTCLPNSNIFSPTKRSSRKNRQTSRSRLFARLLRLLSIRRFRKSAVDIDCAASENPCCQQLTVP